MADANPSTSGLNKNRNSDPEFKAKLELMNELKQFWEEQAVEIEKTGTDPQEFKNQQLPLARIKKIMKSDEDVRMISAEAPVVFAKACEYFIQELTLRGLHFSNQNKRRTLTKEDIALAVHNHELFDFLLDSVPEDERDERTKVKDADHWERAGSIVNGGNNGGNDGGGRQQQQQQQQQQQGQHLQSSTGVNPALAGSFSGIGQMSQMPTFMLPNQPGRMMPYGSFLNPQQQQQQPPSD